MGRCRAATRPPGRGEPGLGRCGARLAAHRSGRAMLAARILAAAVLIQIITNLQNDVGCTLRHAERSSRVGLPRATANGWLGVAQVRTTIIAVVGVAVVIGLPLVQARGLPVLLMGLGSIAAALALNNHRDIAHDAEVGRRTLGVCFGVTASQWLYTLTLLTPFAVTAALGVAVRSPALLLPLALLPVAWRLRREMLVCNTGSAYTSLAGAYLPARTPVCRAVLVRSRRRAGAGLTAQRHGIGSPTVSAGPGGSAVRHSGRRESGRSSVSVAPGAPRRALFGGTRSGHRRPHAGRLSAGTVRPARPCR